MKYVAIGSLEPGTKVETRSGTLATIIHTNYSRTRVRLGEATKKTITRTVKGIEQATKSYAVTVPAHETDWGSSTEVRVIGSEKLPDDPEEVATVKRGRPPTDPAKRKQWDAANDRARQLRERAE